MKKLVAMTAICVAGMVFAQEPAAPEAAVPAGAPKCECAEGTPCQCGAEKKAPAPGEFRRNRGQRGEGAVRGKRGPQGERPAMRRPPMPKVKKCECSPECKGVIILPPNATEGEPLFKVVPPPESMGPRPGANGRPRGRRPQAEAPAPKPE